ncbi:MAG: T9SS type A sorting domain-containing protein [Chitinophagales bacterium]
MKKHLLLFAFLTLFVFKIFAGSGGPDNFGYVWKDSNDPNGPAYNWIDITQYFNASEVTLLGDDNSRGPFETNFTFLYYWYDVSQFWIGSNGYLLFHEGQIASPFPTFPNSLLPNDVLGVFCNDLTFAGIGDTAKCYWWINATHDTLIVSWIHVPYFDTNVQGFSGDNTFQIILSNVDSSITYQYKSVTPTSPYSGYSSVGIENYSGSDGLQWPLQNTVISPGNNFAIKFYYPHPPLITSFTDAAIMQNDNPSTGGIFVVDNGVPYPLSARVQNYSMSTVDPFDVKGKVVDPAGDTISSEDLYTDTLTQSQNVPLIYTTSFQPTETGTYQFITQSELSGDQISNNNSKDLEMVVVDSSQDMWLGYDGGQMSNFFSINWVGGSGGVGMYYKPPIYPVAITKLHFWIAAFGGSDAFSARIYDDDGVQGLPHTVLDSIYVTASDITLNGWTDIDIPDPLIINSGGFYVSWDEQSTAITLACGNIIPISNRSYELFRDIWGIFRYREIYDPMIAATAVHYSYPTGINSVNQNELSLQVFPNPAVDQSNLIYTISDESSNATIELSNLQGKIIRQINLGRKSGEHQLALDVSTLPAGIYLATLKSGKEQAVQKLVIAE